MANANSTSLSNLLGKASLDDHEQVLKAAEAALEKSKSDSQVQHAKVVALLKLDRYEDAVLFIEENGTELKERAGLEYAYALYKVGRLDEAARIALGTKKSRAALHIAAQAKYRSEDFVETARLYQEIKSEGVANEQFDLSVNQGAIDALGQWLGTLDHAKARRPGREDLETFETAYNAACGSIARGELTQAEMLLKRSKSLCEHNDELTADEKAQEILPITVQQVYVLQRLGKLEEAETLSKSISVDSVSDLSTRKIAQSNMLSASKNSNPFLIHKAFSSTPKVPESDKLFSYQSIPLSSNEKTIELNSFKFNGFANSTKQSSVKASVSPENMLQSVFKTAACARTETGKAAVSRVLPELKKSPNDIGLVVTLVQLHILTGNSTSAIELMEALLARLDASTDDSEKALRYMPGLVSIMIGLYRNQGQKSQMKRELAKAASYWRHKSKPPVSLLRAAGITLLASSNSEDLQTASEIFDKLYEQQPNDKGIIAGYVASHAISEYGTVKSLAEKLTSVSELTKNIDVNALETAGIPQSSNALAIAQAGRSRKRAATSDGPATDKKRIRKSRLPKNYDPNAKIDTERWQPMRDRSYYRPPKGKKKAKKDDRTQGGGTVNESLDISSKPPASEVLTASSGKKKKGKGKK